MGSNGKMGCGSSEEKKGDDDFTPPELPEKLNAEIIAAKGLENAHAKITEMMGEQLAKLCDEKVKELGSAEVGSIATDGYGNEVNVHLTTEDTSKFWLVTARGKIIALKEADNDNDKMSK